MPELVDDTTMIEPTDLSDRWDDLPAMTREILTDATFTRLRVFEGVKRNAWSIQYDAHNDPQERRIA